nr:hypothetical protein [Tanacetum cinerariifolium]
MRCESGLSKGLCLICGNNQNSLNDSPSISENSSQSPPHINHHCCYECGDPLDGIFYKRCTCRSCVKGAHIGYNCPPKVPVIFNPEPCKSQTINETPQTLPSFHPTCDSGDESPLNCDSTPNIVDDSPNVFNPHPQPSKYSYEFCGSDTYYGYDCPPQVTLTYDPEPCYNQDFNFPQNSQYFQQQHLCCTHYGGPHETFQSWSKNIQQKKEEEEKQIAEEQAAKARYQKILICYDDDKDYTIAITPKEPEDSLIMGVEHLDTIPTTESDEFIKSSVENLVPNPSESEGEHEYDVPVCDDFTTFLNLLFDADEDFSSSDDEFLIISSSLKIDYLLDEFIGELILLKSIPPGIDKADCNPEEEICLIKKLLYDNASPRPPKEFNSENSDAIIESFSPSPILAEDIDLFIEDINLFLASDGSIPPGINNDCSNSEGDNLFLKRLLHDDHIPLSNILDFSNVI